MRRLFKTPRLAARLALDVALLLLFVTSLAFRSTGREAHEWVGVSFCLLFIVHTLWNWGWYKNIFTGTYSTRRTINIIINLALLATMTALCVCGIANSRHVFRFSQIIDGERARQLHSLAAYWSLVLVGVHIGLHWDMIVAAARKRLNFGNPRKRALLLNRMLVCAVLGFGVWASFERDMGSKLFLGFSFDYWPADQPLALFYVCHLTIMGNYVFVAHYFPKIRFHSGC